MRKPAVLNEEILNADEVLKLTALVYFEEALQKQQYEKCAELTAAARKFGAVQADIDAVIADNLRSGPPEGQNTNRIQTRRKQLKQKE